MLGSIDCYNSALSSILNAVAPVKERVVSFSKSSPWYTNDLRALKVEGRKIERLYNKSGLTVHKLMFEQHQLQYHLVLKTSREAYYSHVINKGAANPRTLFKTIDSLLNLKRKLSVLLMRCVIILTNILPRKFRVFIASSPLTLLC